MRVPQSFNVDEVDALVAMMLECQEKVPVGAAVKTPGFPLVAMKSVRMKKRSREQA